MNAKTSKKLLYVGSATLVLMAIASYITKTRTVNEINRIALREAENLST